MRNLLSQLDLSNLCVGKYTHDLAVLLDGGKISFDGRGVLDGLLGVFGECLLLGSVPILVESALAIIIQVTSPYSLECTKTIGSSHVSNNTHNDLICSFVLVDVRYVFIIIDSI